MHSCDTIDSLVTPFIDGELAPAERTAVEDHLRACGPCQQRVEAERAVRRLIHDCKLTLRRECASSALRNKCAKAALPIASRGALWRARLAPFALAASLVLLVGFAFLYQLTARSTTVMAAELTADHLKCFAVNDVIDTHQSLSVVESSLAGSFGWNARLPTEPERAGLELVGARQCLYGQGRVAHIMYRYRGRPVSLFMLPHVARTETLTSVLGHQCAVWSSGNRTFVLIAREPRDDVARMASFVQRTMR